ncbi:hypothetical protein HRR83_004079 [Exophiala dermatitidis]|uniref:Uncharacterized protein n=1 Tax=Exophiala dermatitidis TaxID=5970 RepID=A0AAN6EMZ2_EXODE|nr:hypothetical protein HRR73_007722 [Exophiala dermatitidis]KAJ4521618.1 hypothetical protein HRR74_003443 [Exophiala dermatitidis]KAJ4530271.1 hypothetical protein HRR77_009587 [Exophiala dermatitidis]KAJ4537370.1 hypothetical protein HRR76_005380 [Exophiala dermatitidis]KAJ4552273.1 hypothetical protein HRR79_009806 [Exophiala dermatitidis]
MKHLLGMFIVASTSSAIWIASSIPFNSAAYTVEEVAVPMYTVLVAWTPCVHIANITIYKLAQRTFIGRRRCRYSSRSYRHRNTLTVTPFALVQLSKPPITRHCYVAPLPDITTFTIEALPIFRRNTTNADN